jgi:hypothetical protein
LLHSNIAQTIGMALAAIEQSDDFACDLTRLKTGVVLGQRQACQLERDP